MKLLLYTFIFSVVVIVGVSLIPEKKSGEAADSGDNSESVAENTEKKSARTAKGKKNAIPDAPSIPAVEVKFKENTRFFGTKICIYNCYTAKKMYNC